MRRRPDGTGFEPVSTAAALDDIAERLRRIIDEHGPRAVASYCGTAMFQNAAALPVGRAFHRAIGSTSFYTSLTIDQPAKMVAPLRIGTWAAGWQPFSTADVSLVVGINTPVSMFGVPGRPDRGQPGDGHAARPSSEVGSSSSSTRAAPRWPRPPTSTSRSAPARTRRCSPVSCA